MDGYIKQADAVIAHDVESQFTRITAPTQITFSRHDQITSMRFAKPLASAIKESEVVILEEASHAPIYESVEEFNQKTLAFLQRHASAEKVSSAT